MKNRRRLEWFNGQGPHAGRRQRRRQNRAAAGGHQQPVDPATKAFLDDTRIRAILPTLQKLVKAKVILLAHQSRPGKDDFTSTLGHARELGRLLGRQVKWVDDIHGPKAMKAIEELEAGQLLMLNNVRMDEQEVSVKGDLTAMSETHLVQRLASVADLFVNDAFACAHRSSPSIVGFTSLLPCVAGELMGNEIRKLDHALETPERPCLAVLGGVKVDDSIQVADNMLRNGIADALWPTGGVANLLLDLAGYDIGEPNRAFLKKELGQNWTSTIKQAKTLIEDHGNSIHLPVDLAANIEETAGHSAQGLPHRSLVLGHRHQFRLPPLGRHQEGRDHHPQRSCGRL